MLFKALPESHSKPVICDQSITQILYTSQIYRQVIFIQQKFATIASVRTTGIRVPSSASTPSILACHGDHHRGRPSWRKPPHGDTKTQGKLLDRNAEVHIVISASEQDTYGNSETRLKNASIRGTEPSDSEKIMNFLALTFYDTRCLISASKRRPRSGFPRF